MLKQVIGRSPAVPVSAVWELESLQEHGKWRNYLMWNLTNDYEPVMGDTIWSTSLVTVHIARFLPQSSSSKGQCPRYITMAAMGCHPDEQTNIAINL